MIVDVTRTIAPVITDISDRHRVRVETIIADFHDTLFAFKCATSERLLRLGVSMAQLNILYVLRRSDEMPMSRLAEVLNVSLSNATGLIDRMEERGFIERTRVLADRRIVMVRLTPEGVRLLEEQDAMSEDLMRRVLDKLKPNQLTVVAQATADSGINKATGLAAVLKQLGRSAEETLAVGDAENDHALLESVGFGVALANAVALLKVHADWVTDGRNGEGVQELIARLIEDKLPPSGHYAEPGESTG